VKEKNVTIRKIAKIAGVSTTTAFRVLSGEGPVKDSTRIKVLAAQDLLENRKDGSTQPESTRSVGIIMPAATAQDIGRHPSMFVTVTNFLSEISSRGITNSVIVFDENTTTGESLLSLGKDGFLVTGTSEEQEAIIIPALSQAHIPCVLVNRETNAPFMSCVNIDDFAATVSATEHLLSLGHRKIVFLGGTRNYQNTKRRVQGFQQAMDSHGISLNEGSIFFGEYSELSGYEMAMKMLALKERPTAAVCASDPIAIGCMRALEHSGIRVPDDFSVIGFGNIDSGRTTTPPLTTVFQCSVEVGCVAARVLMQMMDMPIIVSQKVLLQTDLVIRGSASQLTTDSRCSKDTEE